MSYEGAGAAIGRLVDKKQAAYGDSFGKSGTILRVLFPDGIRVEQYDDMLAMVRIIDKLFRVATDRDAMGENPFKDIAGYGLLGAARVREKMKVPLTLSPTAPESKETRYSFSVDMEGL